MMGFMMGFMMELFFTASLSLCLAFLFAKLVSMASALQGEEGVVSVSKKETFLEDTRLANQGLEAEDVGGESMNINEVVGEEASEKSKLVEFVEDLVEEGSNVDQNTDAAVEVAVKKEESEVGLTSCGGEIEGASCEIELEERKTEEGLLGGDDEHDDDWEGIERSEVEKLFGSAAKFVDSSENNELVSELGNDVKMQLYALHKVAMEGPCREAPPMALMVSARAKWNAWQRLGNMTPEAAMEQYISLLSGGIPGWIGRKPEGNDEQDKGNNTQGQQSKVEPQERLSLHHQPDSINGRKLEELQSHGERIDAKSL